MTVHLVVEGERGEGYSVVGVFSSLPKAVTFAAGHAQSVDCKQRVGGDKWQDSEGVDFVQVVSKRVA